MPRVKRQVEREPKGASDTIREQIRSRVAYGFQSNYNRKESKKDALEYKEKRVRIQRTTRLDTKNNALESAKRWRLQDQRSLSQNKHQRPYPGLMVKQQSWSGNAF